MMNNIKKIIALVLIGTLLSGCQSRADKILTIDEQIVMDTEEEHEISQFQIGAWISEWYEKGITGKNVRIAILDTGVEVSNKDLSIIDGANFTSENIEDYNDDNGHGTKIAGIIGARHNDYNLLGIAYDSDLYIAKVANAQGTVQFEDFIKGIQWAIEKDVNIINISLEFEQDNEEVHDAIKQASDKGILVVASSGNLMENEPFKAYPAQYEEVISIGMLDMYGRVYDSQFLEKKVDLFAPGQDIASLYFDEKMTLDTGASFATAYATGYLALEYQNQVKHDNAVDKDTLVKLSKDTLEKHIGKKTKIDNE